MLISFYEVINKKKTEKKLWILMVLFGATYDYFIYLFKFSELINITKWNNARYSTFLNLTTYMKIKQLGETC